MRLSQVSQLNLVQPALPEYLDSTGVAGQGPWSIETFCSKISFCCPKVKSLVTLLNPPSEQPHQVGLGSKDGLFHSLLAAIPTGAFRFWL